MTNRFELSLVTGTLNRPDSFRRLLRSIQQHTSVSWQLVVSDASDTPVYVPSSELRNVIVLPERPRLGCTKGYNRAFSKARGKWVIFLNDDCEVTPRYDTAAIQYMESHPAIGLGALYYSDPNHSGWKVNECCYGMLYANFGIIERQLGNEVGWFDEALTMYGNDNSLAYKVLMAEKGISAISDSRIVHHSENDPHREENNDLPYRIAQSELLKLKYGPHLEQMRAVYNNAQSVQGARNG